MNRIIVVTLLAALIGLVTSCNSDREVLVGPPGPYPMPGVISIKVGDTRTIQPYGLEITFDTVLGDSRCPVGAYCFWGGMAKIKLYVASSDQDRQALIFHVDAAQPAPDSSRYVVTDAGRFRIDLRNLTPYPDINEQHLYADYRIALAVEPYQAADSVVGAVVPSRLPVSGLLGERNAIGSVRVDRSQLKMTVTYGGGCHVHNYTLFMDPVVFAESAPVQANLYLHHYGDGDFCRALITEELSFDLQPMLDLHMQYYGHEDEILLNVYHQPDSTWVLEETVLYEPPEHHIPILPMAMGNYWVYADSTWKNGVIESSIDTVKVIDHETDSLGDWWVLSQPLLSLGDRIMLKGDSIYTSQYGWTGPYAEREYIPPVDTPYTYHMILYGDIGFLRTVFRSFTMITTPAGAFDGLYGYDCRFYCSEPLRQFIKPGVGFIYQEQWPCAWGTSSVFTRRTWLVEYYIAE
jgi:hypothetical protein